VQHAAVQAGVGVRGCAQWVHEGTASNTSLFPHGSVKPSAIGTSDLPSRCEAGNSLSGPFFFVIGPGEAGAVAFFPELRSAPHVAARRPWVVG